MTASRSATGFAVTWPTGKIDVRSVALTERAAKVNWLHVNGTQMTMFHSDKMIEELFVTASMRYGVSCVPVRIHVDKPKRKVRKSK